MAALLGVRTRPVLGRHALLDHYVPVKPTFFSVRPRAASPSSPIANEPKFEPSLDSKASNSMRKLACPICFCPLTEKTAASNGLGSTYAIAVECCTCQKEYHNNGIFLNLAIAGGFKDYDEAVPVTTEFFGTTLVSYLYERGWRQNFFWSGFPGVQREFEMAREYLKFTAGGTIIDASCGSGLFSRLFAKSGMYSLVVALDFSSNMLLQCHKFLEQEHISKDKLILVRADISRLPFLSHSIDAVHAGAALHCWPSPSSAVAEISRVLRPGGVFVATTFVADGIATLLPFLRTIRQLYTRSTGNHIYTSEDALEDLCRGCGLVNFSCMRNGSFIMLSATKPM